MSEGGSRASGGSGPRPEAPREGGSRAEGAPRALHPHSFKLRFAAQREPGRSYVSLVRPPGIPAPVAGKPQAREAPAAEGARAAALERRVAEAFALGPRERLPRPLTTSHAYGWHAGPAPPRADRRLQHHLRDSAWLKARLRVLAADDKLKPR